MKNFHLPLPDDLYRRLSNAALRSQKPATSLARTAIDFWLTQEFRDSRSAAIAAFAAAAAGTDLDLDPSLEATGIEHLLKSK